MKTQRTRTLTWWAIDAAAFLSSDRVIFAQNRLADQPRPDKRVFVLHIPFDSIAFFRKVVVILTIYERPLQSDNLQTLGTRGQCRLTANNIRLFFIYFFFFSKRRANGKFLVLSHWDLTIVYSCFPGSSSRLSDVLSSVNYYHRTIWCYRRTWAKFIDNK